MDENQIIEQKASLTTYKHPVSTILQPNAKGIIYAVGTFLHEQLEEKEYIPGNGLADSFNEEKYCHEDPAKFKEAVKSLLFRRPSVEEICEFVELLQTCGRFQSECLIIALIYLNRFKCITGTSLLLTNWRPLLISSIMVADKVWESKNVSHAYLAFIHPFFNIEQIQKLEKLFLELIDYNVKVKMSLYVNYYFELRSSFQREFDFGIDESNLKTLESRSDSYKEMLLNSVKKCQTH